MTFVQQSSCPSSSSIDGLEERASAVVLAVQKCVESLRTVKEFNEVKPAALWSAAKATAKDSNPLEKIGSVNLLSHLEDQGVVKAVQAIISRGPYDTHNDSAKDFFLQMQHASTNSPTSKDDPPRQLAITVLLPLADELCESYDPLDRIPTQSPPQQQQATTVRSSRKKNQPPPPPPGMLSLQNYTDIGAFLEFTVCSTILPFLQPNILFPVQDRARYFLPKSLAGRVSRPSLLWAYQQRCAPPKGKELLFMNQIVQDLKLTVVMLGRLLLLDRFRPMLLPRHLSDLYAAMFQAEAYSMRLQQMKQQLQDLKEPTAVDSLESSAQLDKEYMAVRTSLLPAENPIHSPAETQTTSPSIDPALQAQSLQTLLLQGTKSPLWLRQRVAKHLTALASKNLPVIMQVFVHAAPPKDKTAASLRLARTLVTPASNNSKNQSKHHNMLIQQLMQILDGTVSECRRNKVPCCQLDSLTAKQTLDVHTVWAILDQLPKDDMQNGMMEHLSRGMLSNERGTQFKTAALHRTVLRLAILLSALPPSMNPVNVALLLFRPLPQSNADDRCDAIQPTIFGQILRLACIPPAVLKSDLQDDAILTLKLGLQTLLQSILSSDKDKHGNALDDVKVDCVQVAAIALVYAVAPSQWDDCGHFYVLDTETEATTPGLLSVEIIEQQTEKQAATNQQATVTTVEKRVAVVLKLVQALDSSHEASGTDDECQPLQGNLLPALFNLLLMMYFSSNALKHQHRSVKTALPMIFRKSARTSGLFRIVSMCFIPPMCENCPTESLLKSSADDGAGLFQMMQLVFTCAGSFFSGDNVIGTESDDAAAGQRSSDDSLIDEFEDEAFIKSSGYFSETIMGLASPERFDPGQDTDGDIDASDIGMVVSVTCLMLGLLVTILDYGTTEARSSKEEALMKSFSNLLKPFAEVRDMPWMKAVVNGDNEVAQALHSSCGEVAEMAAHALALLAARKAQAPPIVDMTSGDQELTPESTIERVLREAQSDLASTEPPMKAKGVVSLQRLLRGALFQKLLDDGEPPEKAQKVLIVEVDNETGREAPSVVGKTIGRVTELAISAIADPESYVYLAAIQCIATAADVSPRHTISRIGLAVASGNLTENEQQESTSLTSAQRVKLAEALIFCIRRRAKIDEFVSMLLDVMLFGEEKDVEKTARPLDQLSDVDSVNTFQRETHDYFVRGRVVDAEDEDVQDLEEKAEKQRIRINTGGPVFAAEESDLVTAARVSVLSELLPAAHPSTLAKYCHTLVITATELLRLEASRPVRRAAALLAREFYGALLREQEELLEMVVSGDSPGCHNTDLELSTALVATTDDGILRATLQRCLQADDLTDSSTYRTFDAATVARCQEALDARQEAVDGGIFAIATLVLESRKLDGKLAAARLVRDLLQKSSGENHRNSLGTLGRLKLDVERLELD